MRWVRLCDGFLSLAISSSCSPGPFDEEESGIETGETGAEVTACATWPNAAPMWTSSTTNASAFALAADADGNLVVAGARAFVTRGETDTDIWVGKYEPDGTLEWEAVSADGGSDDLAMAAAFLGDGSVAVTGIVSFGAQVSRAWVGVFEGDGKLAWSQTHAGLSDELGDDEGHGLAPTSDGGFVVVGRQYDGVDVVRNIWVRKYSREGEIEWADVYDAGLDDDGIAVLVTPDQSVVAIGIIELPEYARDLWVRKYTNDGEVIWTRRVDFGFLPLSLHEWVKAAVLDVDGSVLLAGGKSPFHSGWLAKLDADGNTEWISDEGFAGIVPASVEALEGCVLTVGEHTTGYETSVGFVAHTPEGLPVDSWTLVAEGEPQLGFGVIATPSGQVVVGVRDLSSETPKVRLMGFNPSR